MGRMPHWGTCQAEEHATLGNMPRWGGCHIGEHTTLGDMPRWGTCHAGEHATLGSMLTGHHGSHILLTHCKCAAAFHHAANTPQLHLRKDSVLTHNRFCCIDDTCRFWALHLSCTTHPDHPQLEGSAVHINTAAHAFAQRFKPHLAPQPHRITSRTPPSPAYKHRSYRITIALDRQ